MRSDDRGGGRWLSGLPVGWPVSVPTALERVQQLKRAGSLDEAVIELEALLAQAPDHAIALTQLADLQLRRGRIEEAAGALDRAEAVAGTTRVTAGLRGDVLFRMQRWQEAARAYQDAVALGDPAPGRCCSWLAAGSGSKISTVPGARSPRRWSAIRRSRRRG